MRPGAGPTRFFASLAQPASSILGWRPYAPDVMKLSLLSVLLGLGLGAVQVYGLARPAGFAAALRKFPRNLAAGYVLMALGTIWFLWNVSQESIADFARFKPHMMVGFAAIGLGTCVFVQDFLAVRGLAVVLLLLAKLMVDTGRPFLGETSWVLVIQVWAYGLVLAGIWLTVSPWRLRDWWEWATANEGRVKVGCALRLAFALLVICLGLTVFRAAERHYFAEEAARASPGPAFSHPAVCT